MTSPQTDGSGNPLYFGVPLRQRIVVPVLGVPVTIESNSAIALEIAEEAFGIWRRLRGAELIIAAPTPDPVRLQVVVHQGEEGSGSEPHTPITYRMPDPSRLIVHTPGSVGFVDTDRGEAIMYVTPQFLADRAHVRYAIFEGSVLSLVTARGRVPVHAAVVARGDSALLLAAPAGTGKSTLAYQAYRAGLRVLADDTAYVQIDPEFRVWGLPTRLSLLPEAVKHFPDIDFGSGRFSSDGREKLMVDVGSSPEPVSRCHGVCLLQRNGGPASLERVSRAEVIDFLERGVGISRHRFGEELDRALARLAEHGGWRLSLSENPADAQPLIEQVLETDR